MAVRFGTGKGTVGLLKVWRRGDVAVIYTVRGTSTRIYRVICSRHARSADELEQPDRHPLLATAPLSYIFMTVRNVIMIAREIPITLIS